MWRDIRRHEEDARKLITFARRAGQRKMSAMDGIEGSAEKANIHAPLVSSFTGLVGKFNLPCRRYVSADDAGEGSGALADRALLHLSVWPRVSRSKLR